MCQKYRKWQWAGQGSYGNCLNFVIVVLDPRDIDAEDREYISVFFFDRVFALRLKFTFKWTSPDGVRTTWTPLFQCMMVWSFTQGLLCHWLWAVIYAWKLVLWIHLIRNQHILCGFHSRLWVCKTLPSQSVCLCSQNTVVTKTSFLHLYELTKCKWNWKGNIPKWASPYRQGGRGEAPLRIVCCQHQ